MALRNGYNYTYSMAKGGVDLHNDLTAIPTYRSPKTKNCFYRDGMIGRKGSVRLTDTEVVSGNAITALHRFYYSSNSKQLLVACETTVKAYDDVSAWDNVATGLTDGNQVTFHTWGPKDAVYVANGADTTFKWDGTTKTNLGAFPSTTKQFIAILDRLAWIDGSNPTFIQYSKAFDDTAVESAQDALKVPGPGIIHGLAYHGLITDAGFATRILVAKGSSIWLLTANDLTPATIDARLDIVSSNIGCEAWRTIQSTPVGTFFLGTDRQVYLITFDMRLETVGTLIRSNRSDTKGLEQIPNAQTDKPFAVYHDNFYKLFFPAQNGTFNSIQYWLDVSRFGRDKALFWGPWYGPMQGQAISHAISQAGPGDNGALIGGEANASTGGYVYTLDSGADDDDTAINYLYQTNFDPHRNPTLNKTVHSIDIEIAGVSGTVNITFFDSTGAQSSGDQVSLSTDAVYWGEMYWGDFYWTASGTPSRYQVVPDNKLTTRYLSIVVEYSSSSENFELYTIMAKGQIRSQIPFVGASSRE